MADAVTVYVWMLRYKPDAECSGDPVSLHTTKAAAEAEREKFYPSTWLVIEPWPVLS